MANLHEVQGYTLALDKVVYITRIFEASGGEGAQFNIRLLGDSLLKLKFPDRSTATMEREMLVSALGSDGRRQTSDDR